MSVEQCAICLDNMADTDDCCQTVCKHAFHRICLNEWYLTRSICPVCRREQHTSQLHSRESDQTTNMECCFRRRMGFSCIRCLDDNEQMFGVQRYLLPLDPDARLCWELMERRFTCDREQADTVVCSSCDAQITGWSLASNPFYDHLESANDCHLARCYRDFLQRQARLTR
jgi:hypothetical protein